MRTRHRDGGSEARRLEFVQRVGRVGYWEYDPVTRAMDLPEASRRLWGDLAGGDAKSPGTFLEALAPAERLRFEAALDEALEKRLAFSLELLSQTKLMGRAQALGSRSDDAKQYPAMLWTDRPYSWFQSHAS